MGGMAAKRKGLFRQATEALFHSTVGGFNEGMATSRFMINHSGGLYPGDVTNPIASEAATLAGTRADPMRELLSSMSHSGGLFR